MGQGLSETRGASTTTARPSHLLLAFPELRDSWVISVYDAKRFVKEKTICFPPSGVFLFVTSTRMAFPIQLRNLKMTASGGDSRLGGAA